jgi:molybdopterin-guanine dinucleotide biosynthesis protein A
MQSLTAIILTGGKSSRMGQDKGLTLYKGIPLINYSIKVMQEVPVTEIIISANNAAYKQFGLYYIIDNHKGIGPIAGLQAALQASSHYTNLIIPCDTPFLEKEIYTELLNPKYQNSDAVILRHNNGKLEPLIAVYRKSALKTIETQISNQQYKLIELFDKLKADFIEVQDHWNVKNINTPEDLHE